MSLQIRVKHAAKVYDVSVETSSPGIALKQQLEQLTGVPALRQKVMVKGRQLPNDVCLNTLALKSGQSLIMLGTAPSEKPAAPASAASTPQTNPKTAKDAEMADNYDDDDVDEDVDLEPLGLTNVGNTCYANATLEALHTVPMLNKALMQYEGSDPLIKAWGSLVPEFGSVQTRQKAPKAPHAFLNRLRERFPQFGELSEEGIPKQQDAEELWTQLMWELRQIDTPALREAVSSFDGQFSVNTERTLADPSAQSEQPAVETTVEGFTKLMCHISSQTNFLKDGLRASLLDTADTNRGTNTSTKRIAKLPKNLTIQFVRFFWRRDTKKNSKILRKVTFPMTLDLGDLCTPELQDRMGPAREAYRELESGIEESKRSARRARFQQIDSLPTEDASKREAAIAAEEAEKRREVEHLEQLKTKFRESIDPDLAADATCSPHALYELQAIVTHQGMSADSGHYQCFTKNLEKDNSWWRFNDDQVSEVDDNRIAQLAGGGASDCALILLYRSADY